LRSNEGLLSSDKTSFKFKDYSRQTPMSVPSDVKGAAETQRASQATSTTTTTTTYPPRRSMTTEAKTLPHRGGLSGSPRFGSGSWTGGSSTHHHSNMDFIVGNQGHHHSGLGESDCCEGGGDCATGCCEGVGACCEGVGDCAVACCEGGGACCDGCDCGGGDC
jgi:hypothetical protein